MGFQKKNKIKWPIFPFFGHFFPHFGPEAPIWGLYRAICIATKCGNHVAGFVDPFLTSFLCTIGQKRLFVLIILFVRNFRRVCSQFWLSVRNSVWGPFNRNSRGNPSLCWLGGGGQGAQKLWTKILWTNWRFLAFQGLLPKELPANAPPRCAHENMHAHGRGSLQVLSLCCHLFSVCVCVPSLSLKSTYFGIWAFFRNFDGNLLI